MAREHNHGFGPCVALQIRTPLLHDERKACDIVQCGGVGIIPRFPTSFRV